MLEYCSENVKLYSKANVFLAISIDYCTLLQSGLNCTSVMYSEYISSILYIQNLQSNDDTK